MNKVLSSYLIKKLTDLYIGNAKILPFFILIFLVNLFLFTGTDIKEHIFLFTDTSREVYIPYAMNKGYLLYKDIFNVYAPLGYQINALLFKFFGSNLKTLYYAGFINSTLILWGLFLILRIFMKRNSSFIIFSTLYLIQASCIFAISHTNYIFPYSYSMVYALNAFIWSLVSLLYFIKKEKNIYIYFAFFFYGLSSVLKYEFILFIFLMLAVLVIKKSTLRVWLISLLTASIIPFISVCSLILQGVNISDFKQAFDYIIILPNVKSSKILYQYSGFIPTTDSLKSSGINFLKIALWILSLISYYIFFVWFYNINRIFFTKHKLLDILYFIFGFCPIPLVFYLLYNGFVISNASVFNWLGLFTLFLFLIYLNKLYKKKSENKLTIRNFMLFTLFISVLLCSYKTIFNISFNSYGTYYFPLLFICCIIYISYYMLMNNKGLKLFLALGIFILASLYALSNAEREDIIFSKTKYVNKEKGSFYIEKFQRKAVTGVLQYLHKETKTTDKILVLPEGAIFNFLTDTLSDNKYYYLIPPNIEIFGEDNVVNDIEKNLPDYVILQTLSYNKYRETLFCESFGEKICTLLPKYYDYPKIFGDNFKLAIYKKKT